MKLSFKGRGFFYLGACLGIAIPAICGRSLAASDIEYKVTPTPPTATTPAKTDVAITLHRLKGPTIKLQMPVWSPGDYHVMNHSQYVRAVSAKLVQGGMALEVTHTDANTWEVKASGDQDIEVDYSLPNTPPGYFSENVMVKANYAFYNGPSLYMYLVGGKEKAASLTLHNPEGWKKAFTPLDAGKLNTEQEIHYEAPDYDTLADSPVVMGTFETRTFTEVNRPHTIVFFNNYKNVNMDSFPAIYAKVVKEENRLMGGPPYKQYAFFIDCGGRGGGLEHLNCHRIAFGSSGNASDAVGMMAHEFFHLWNVKRIRPFVLGPFDYVNPPKTRNLWFSEGVTSYYAWLCSLRAGLTTREEFMQGMLDSSLSFRRDPNATKVTVDDSSYRVWEANNSSGYLINYYTKGELLGLYLDMKIRILTQGKLSLDNVMRNMMAKYSLPKPGFPEDGIRDEVIAVAGPAMGPYYDMLARSTVEMPFEELFAQFGMRSTAMDLGNIINKSASPVAVALREGWLTGK
ncbi:MAG: hypothetical protein ABJA67_18670 [Chthonomonadales bacterium]